ncbi:MAG TPA: FAD-dependent monooxygenase [Anaerolineae bacterium]|nr:FAD-dependent monooxygenase [Anaerolineae bacterium]
MPIEQVDVLVIGCSLAGASAALHLLRHDPAWAGRIVMIDKAIHPREKLCGGGVTHIGHNILTRLGLRFEPLHLMIREMRLVYRGRSISLRGAPIFRVVRRAEFDHWLIGVVEKLGVGVRQGEAQRVVQVTPADEHVAVATTSGVFHARIVVAADGARSFVRRALKWEGAAHVARLLEVLTPEPRSAPEFREGVAVFDFTPIGNGLQGYTWHFPSLVSGQPFMNRGVFDSRIRPERSKADLKQILRESLAQYGWNLDDHELKGHPLRWWDRNARFAVPRVLLAGDAAGVDPLLGEGISFALGYGEAAASAIVDAFERGDFGLATYADRLLAHPLFRQLDARTRLARLLYRIGATPLAGLIWQVLGWRLRFTPWRDPEFTLDETPAFSLIERSDARN